MVFSSPTTRESETRGCTLLAAVILIVVLGVLAPNQATSAEIRGSVSVRYAGLFQADTGLSDIPVSVALLPADGRKVKLRKARVRRAEIIDNRIMPAFITLQSGDSVEFVNRDSVFHQLFSVSPERPFDITLSKVDQDARNEGRVAFDKPGTVHIFCRIHNRSYARVDVLATPHQQMVSAGESFDFTGISSGTWLLRLASPGAETLFKEVQALTSPPALHLELRSHNGGSGKQSFSGQYAIDQLYTVGGLQESR
jgi:plastocyanin